MKKLNAKEVRDLAKQLGVKEYWLKNRATLVSEIVIIKGWEKESEAVVEFLMAGGEIKSGKDSVNQSSGPSVESSAGKSGKEHNQGFSKKASLLVSWTEVQVSQDELLKTHLEEMGTYPITEDTLIFGNNGLYNQLKTFGLNPDKAFETQQEETEKMARKITKEKPETSPKKKAGRDKKPTEGLTTLSDLCDKYGVEPRIARRKLRGSMEKPESGWNFTPEEVEKVVAIITK